MCGRGRLWCDLVMIEVQFGCNYGSIGADGGAVYFDHIEAYPVFVGGEIFKSYFLRHVPKII